MVQTSPVELVDINVLIANYLQIVKEQLEEDSDQNSIFVLLQTFLEKITTELKQSLFEFIKEIQGNILTLFWELHLINIEMVVKEYDS